MMVVWGAGHTPCEASLEHEDEEHGGYAGAVASDSHADSLANENKGHSESH